MGTSECYVYLMQRGAGGPVKIGLSVRPEKRNAQLQTATAEHLRIVATVLGGSDMERELHARFASSRLNGEWFHPTAAIFAWFGERVATACAAAAPAPPPAPPAWTPQAMHGRIAGIQARAATQAATVADVRRARAALRGPR